MSTLTRDRVSGRRIAEAIPGAREHIIVVTGQLVAGAGNLVFALVMARVLAPGAFAQLAAFLALYTLGHLFVGSLGAGTALSPHTASEIRDRLWRVGVAVVVGAVLLRGVLAEVLGLSTDLVLALAVAAPAAGVLATERGRLYGTSRYGTVVRSLLAEPAVRLTAGIVLALVTGAAGAAAGVALAGWAALAVTVSWTWRGRMSSVFADRVARPADPPAASPASDGLVRTRSRGASFAFFLLAVVMAQDLLLANRLLESHEAARFAVVSTLGGMAVFASATVPYVLLGRSGTKHALRTALLTAGALGGLITLGVLASADDLIGMAFGERYADVADLATPYVGAMAVFATARVLAADLCARGRDSIVLWVTGATVVLQGSAIIVLARSAHGVTMVTLASTVGLMAALAVVHLGSRVRSERSASVPEETGSAAPDTTTPAAPVLDPPAGPPLAEPETTSPVAEPPVVEPTVVEAPVVEAPELAPVEATKAEPWVDLRRWIADVASSSTVRIVGLLTLLGLAVRFMSARSIWLDEAIAVSQAKLPFAEMIEVLRFQDVHPPLHQTVLWATVRLIGSSEFAVRLPSMLAGAALIPLLYVAGRELYDRRTGLIAAALGTLAPFLVWYSQEARMYSLFALFALAAVVGQFQVLRRGRIVDWVVFGAATALLLWTQYFAIIQVVVQQAIFLFVAWRRWRNREPVGALLGWWAATMFVVALALLPMAGILRDQVVAYGNRGGAGFDDVPAQAGTSVDASGQGLSLYAVAANIVWALWGYHSNEAMTRIVAVWPLAMLGILLLLGRGRSRSTVYLLAVAGGAIGVFVALGFVRRDLFELRYFAGVVPLLLIFGARALAVARVGRTARRLAVAALLATLGVGLVDQQFNGANPRVYDFRGALSEVSEVTRPDDVVLYAPQYLDPVIRYYGSELDAKPLAEGAVPRSGRVVVVASFLDKESVSAQVGSALAEMDRERELVERMDLRQVRVWVFT